MPQQIKPLIEEALKALPNDQERLKTLEEMEKVDKELDQKYKKKKKGPEKK